MTFSTNKALRYIIFLLVLVASFYFFYLIREVLFTFLAGAILAYFLYRPVTLIEKKGLKRIWAIVLIYLIFAAVLFLIMFFAIPSLVEQLSGLARVLPQYADQAQDVSEKIEDMHLPARVEEIIDENSNKIENYLYGLLKAFIAGLYAFLSKALIIVFAPILAFYILKDWEMIRDKFLQLLPPSNRREISMLAEEINNVLLEFFKGHMLVSALLGLMTGITAAIIGVKFALVIGIISGVTNLVPYFGPILGGIPAVGIAFSESLNSAIYMAGAIVIIQQLESNIITPKIIGDRLGMHPLMIVFALLAGGKLLGIWGMLIAVPLTAALKIIIFFLYLKIVEK